MATEVKSSRQVGVACVMPQSRNQMSQLKTCNNQTGSRHLTAPSNNDRLYCNIPTLLPTLLPVPQKSSSTLVIPGQRQTWNCDVNRTTDRLPSIALNNFWPSRHSAAVETTQEYTNLSTSYNDQVYLECCSFYYHSMSMTLARDKLKNLPSGTFILRDSSDPRFRYSISVRTGRGTTSIRIARTPTGRYRPDCDRLQETTMPSFNGVLDLVRHYVTISVEGRQNSCVLLEGNGHTDTPLVLRRPYLEAPEGLQHLCRKKIHSLLPRPSGIDRTSNINRLPLYDPTLKAFLNEYPYDV